MLVETFLLRKGLEKCIRFPETSIVFRIAFKAQY